MPFKEKRAKQRVSTNIEARFFHGNLFYSGTVTNLSEKGMFINTRRCLPSESMFVIIIRLESELMKVIARVRRSERNNLDCDGVGVELLGPSVEYLEFVNRLK